MLTKDNFDTYTADKDLVLVEFYAPWCGHCKKLEPEYERAATRLLANDPPIHLGKVDATKESELAKEYGVGGYPTLKILRKGKRFDYNGPREEDGIVKYMKEQARPAAQVLDSARTASRIITSADDVAVIAFVCEDSTEQDAFVQVRLFPLAFSSNIPYRQLNSCAKTTRTATSPPTTKSPRR